MQHPGDLDDEERVPAGVRGDALGVGRVEVAGLLRQLRRVRRWRAARPTASRRRRGRPPSSDGRRGTPTARRATTSSGSLRASRINCSIRSSSNGSASCRSSKTSTTGPRRASPLSIAEHPAADLRGVVAVLLAPRLAEAEREPQPPCEPLHLVGPDPRRGRRSEPLEDDILRGVRPRRRSRGRSSARAARTRPPPRTGSTARPAPSCRRGAGPGTPRPRGSCRCRARRAASPGARARATRPARTCRRAARARGAGPRAGSCSRSDRAPGSSPTTGHATSDSPQALRGDLHARRRTPPAPLASWTVVAPTRTSPGAAACCSRAPMLTSAPITMLRSLAVPTATCPVLTPMRTSHRRSADPSDRPSRSAPVAHRDRRPDRADRVVVVRDRRPEHPEHRVADEALRDPAEPRDLLAHHPVERGQHLAEALGIEPGGELGGAGQVDEDDRDDPPLGRRRGPRPARRSSGRSWRARAAARRSAGRSRGSSRVFDDLDRVAVGIAEGREPGEALDLADEVVERGARAANRARASSRSSTRSTTVPLAGTSPSSTAPCSANRTGPASSSAHSSPVATREREPDDVRVEGHRAVHVAGPVVEVVDGPDHDDDPIGRATRVRPDDARSGLAEDLRLLLPRTPPR